MKQEILESLSSLIITASGMVAALALNDAIRSLFVEGGPLYIVSSYGVWIYAIIVSICAALVTVYLGRLKKGKPEEVNTADVLL